jgi:hypothetical protein
MVVGYNDYKGSIIMEFHRRQRAQWRAWSMAFFVVLAVVILSDRILAWNDYRGSAAYTHQCLLHAMDQGDLQEVSRLSTPTGFGLLTTDIIQGHAGKSLSMPQVGQAYLNSSSTTKVQIVTPNWMGILSRTDEFADYFSYVFLKGSWKLDSVYSLASYDPLYDQMMSQPENSTSFRLPGLQRAWQRFLLSP